MHNIKIITGHYGSGKTEFAVSLAMQLADHAKVALADLDIVNPYFRSRERAQLMEQKGIRVISSSLGHNSSLDLPAISAEIRGPIGDPDTEVILDVGGDHVGARALVGFRNDILKRGYDMYLVINSYRPETGDVEGVLKHLEAIEYSAKLKFTGLIVNTHMIRQTTAEDILHGYRLAKRVQEKTQLPIVYISAIPEALKDLPEGLEGEQLPIGMYMREAWM